MVPYEEWLELVRKELKEDYKYTDQDITDLFSQYEGVIIDDYKRVTKYVKENPELKDSDALTSGICSTLNLLY